MFLLLIIAWYLSGLIPMFYFVDSMNRHFKRKFPEQSHGVVTRDLIVCMLFATAGPISGVVGIIFGLYLETTGHKLNSLPDLSKVWWGK